MLLQGSMIFLSFLSLVKTRNRPCGPSADNASRLVFNTPIVRDTRAVGGSVRHYRPSMTVVEMPPVNVGSCVTAFMQQRMAPREMGLVRRGRRGRWGRSMM